MITTVNGDVATFGGLEGLFSNAVSAAIALAGIALLITLLFGGFNLITAGSEAPKAEAAKKTITFAILGFVLVTVSYLILSIISNFTGNPGALSNFSVIRP